MWLISAQSLICRDVLENSTRISINEELKSYLNLTCLYYWTGCQGSPLPVVWTSSLMVRFKFCKLLTIQGKVLYPDSGLYWVSTVSVVKVCDCVS